MKFFVTRVIALSVLLLFISTSMLEAAKLSGLTGGVLLCTGTGVRIRSAPSTKAKILGHLEEYEFVYIWDEKDTGEEWTWYRIGESSEKLPRGWVYGKYLSPFE